MIQLENVQKTYGTYHLNLSMTIPAGRVTGLVGKNGAGKSTVIKAILGLIRIDAGSVKVNGIEAKKMKPADKEKIGVALSEGFFSKELNPADICAILKRLYHRFDGDWFQNRCLELGLPMNKKVGDYSTGMKAKLRVLVAMSHAANLLILDEPTAGLDVEARGEILDMLRDYIAEDEERSILITSHISSDLEGLCDDIYLIDNGQILLHEDTDVLLDCYGILKVDEETYAGLDKACILSTVKESYGYRCFTKEKQYYQENYPGIVVENGSIDEMILIMTGGKRV